MKKMFRRGILLFAIGFALLDCGTGAIRATASSRAVSSVEAPGSALLPLSENQTHSFDIIEVALPGEPVHEVADRHFLGEDMLPDETWLGWEGTLDIYNYSDEALNLDIIVEVASVTDKTVKTHIAPLLEDAADDKARLGIIDAQATHFTDHALEKLGLRPRRLRQALEWKDGTEGGGREVSIETEDGPVKMQEGYTYQADGRKVVSRIAARGNLRVAVYALSQDEVGYAEGQKILDTIRALRENVWPMRESVK